VRAPIGAGAGARDMNRAIELPHVARRRAGLTIAPRQRSRRAAVAAPGRRRHGALRACPFQDVPGRTRGAEPSGRSGGRVARGRPRPARASKGQGSATRLRAFCRRFRSAGARHSSCERDGAGPRRAATASGDRVRSAIQRSGQRWGERRRALRTRDPMARAVPTSRRDKEKPTKTHRPTKRIARPPREADRDEG